MSVWPSSVCTMRRSAPLCSRWLAKAWRSTCGETSRGASPDAAASSFRSRAKCCRVRWPLSPNEGNSHFELAAFFCFSVLSASHRGEVIGHRLPRGLVQRHQPLLVALAAHHDHAGVAARRRQRQRHQFGDAQAGGVEHFQQAMQPHRAQPLLGRSVRAASVPWPASACGRRRISTAPSAGRGRASGRTGSRRDRRCESARSGGSGTDAASPTAGAPRWTI